MIVGTGVDLAEVSSIRTSIERFGERFVRRIYTAAEIAYVERKANRYERYAARFSAKESIVKALGCGFGEKIGWQDIEISHDKAGKPVVHFSPAVQKKFKKPKVILSISHCREYVSTVALLLP